MQQGSNSTDKPPVASSDSTQLSLIQGQGQEVHYPGYRLNNGEPFLFVQGNQVQTQNDSVQPFLSDALKNLLRAAFPGDQQQNAWWKQAFSNTFVQSQVNWQNKSTLSCTINLTISNGASTPKLICNPTSSEVVQFWAPSSSVIITELA